MPTGYRASPRPYRSRGDEIQVSLAVEVDELSVVERCRDDGRCSTKHRGNATASRLAIETPLEDGQTARLDLRDLTVDWRDDGGRVEANARSGNVRVDAAGESLAAAFVEARVAKRVAASFSEFVLGVDGSLASPDWQPLATAALVGGSAASCTFRLKGLADPSRVEVGVSQVRPAR